MAVPIQRLKPRLKRGAAALAVCVTLFASLIGASVAQAAAARKSSILIVDANTGNVLYANAPDEARYPASLAKMMTLYIVFELIDQGQLSYQTKIRFSANAAGQAPSRLDVEEGEEISLIDAIKVLITKSANDVAVAIAEHIAGTEERFAHLMTRKAHQLGMAATTFRNASGLPDDEQVTSARDMATLALRLQDNFPRQYPLFATRTYTYKDETFRNHNTLLFNYAGTDGLKTGYIRASGFNLVTSVRRGRKHVVGVIFGGASAASRNGAMRTYLNMGLVKASSERTRKPSTLSPVLVAGVAPPPEHRIAVPTPRRVSRPATQHAPAQVAPPRAAEPAEARAAQPIEIARVRPVLIGQPPAAGAAGDGVPPLRRTVSTIEDILARAEGSSIPQWATASAGTPMHLPLAVPADKPALMAAPVAMRGTAPSTFEAQAANLARGDAAVAAATGAITARPAAYSVAPQGGFQIQIGAFQSVSEAERKLAAIRDRAPGLLERAAATTQQVKQGGRVLYRARYAGFDQQSAASTCGELKRLKIDCLVMRPD